ncbi:hypothetical protein ACFE04_023978 [Oxalis oulophora]
MFSNSIRFLLISTLLVISSVVVAAIGQPRLRIEMTNNIGPGLNLVAHCRSADNDLGPQVLKPKEKYEFSFKPNIWGSTMYYCQFIWDFYVHSFNIYVYTRDEPVCEHECIWEITKKGACRHDGSYMTCYDWKTVTKA